MADSADAILDFIFNPAGVPVAKPSKVYTSDDYGVDQSVLDNMRKIEKDAIVRAEAKDYAGAEELLTQVIGMCSKYASAFNNRAQVHKLQGHVDKALEDLTQAIAIADGRTNVLREAHTQRGIIYKEKGQKELALKDFKIGAEHGSQFAQQQVVDMNPYASLSNEIFENAVEELKKTNIADKPTTQSKPVVNPNVIDLENFDVDSLFLPKK